MLRLIDADALLHKIQVAGYGARTTRFVCADIASAPTIDAEPVRHGRWERGGKDNMSRYCQHCKNRHLTATPRNYCAKCGCRMDLEEGEVRYQ